MFARDVLVVLGDRFENSLKIKVEELGSKYSDRSVLRKLF